MSSDFASDDRLARVGDESRALQAAVDAFDQAVADRLAINRTDLRCLDELVRLGSAGPAELAKLLGLTSGSTTTLLDRLERAGYVVRAPDHADRRKVVVRPTPAVLELTGSIYGPLAAEGAGDLSSFSPA